MWKAAGLIVLLSSGIAMASLPARAEVPGEQQQRQWQALGIAPLASGGKTGMRMDATDAVEGLAFVARRTPAPEAAPSPSSPPPLQAGPIRIRGRVGDGLYWSLRAAGCSPQVAAQYLTALATQIDVGEVGVGDGFDMVWSASGGGLLYAGIDRVAAPDLQLVRWTANGRTEWVDAANAERPAAAISTGFTWPVAGRITSYFGNRYHPILHFTRFHAGLDFGAAWGSPIVAAADGQVVAAGWAGGYGREVRIAHGGGLTTVYGHMSGIVASPGSFVRAGQLIGYVGSSGLSTGPHLHYEVRQNGVAVNPLGVRFVAAAPPVDRGFADAVRARLHALLSVGVRRG
jgi:hypothetical protein